MNWTDVNEIAIQLYDEYPEVDPLTVNFVQLRNWVLSLEGFCGKPDHCGEKVLEAIQAAWIAEAE